MRDIIRFRLAAEEAHVALPDDDEELKRELLSCGTVLDDKLFAKSESMNDELRSKIEAIFAEGYVIIYYESLFYAEQEWMEHHNKELYDDAAYPPLEEVPRRFAISRRNEWLVDHADVVVAYVTHDWGGAATTLKYAERKKKKIILLNQTEDSNGRQ